MNAHESQKPLVLENAQVVLSDRVIKRGSVVIDSGLITGIGDVSSLPGATIIDVSDLVLLPGFIDVHNHGAIGVDVMEATPNGLREVSEYLATQGVTGWLPTLVPGSNDDYEHVANAVSGVMRDSALRGARVLGLHYEGPFVNSVQCGALHVEHFKTYSRPEDLDVLRVPENGVRMITLAPEITGGVDLVREL